MDSSLSCRTILSLVSLGVALSCVPASFPATCEKERVQSRGPDPEEAFKRGKQLYYKSGLLQDALEQFTLATESSRKRVLAYANRASVHLAMESMEAAKRDIETALTIANEMIQQDPDSGEAYEQRGFAHIIDDKCERRELYEMIGIHAPIGGDSLDRAIADYGEALRREPQRFDSLRLRAWAYVQRDRAAEAIEDCDKALAIEPNDRQLLLRRKLEVLLTRAAAYRKVGQWEKALLDYEKALSAESTRPRVLLARARALAEDQKWDKALDDCSRVIEIDPENARAHVLRAWCWFATDRFLEALEAIESGVRIDPKCAADWSLIDCLIRNLRPAQAKEALPILDRICEAAPGESAYYLARAWAHALCENRDGALADCDKAAALGPPPGCSYLIDLIRAKVSASLTAQD